MTVLRLRRHVVDEIHERAIAGHPDEVCGLIVVSHTAVQRVVPLRNADPWPERGYTVAPAEVLATFADMDDRGENVLAVYHSHTSSPAIPSKRDLDHWPPNIGAQLIVSTMASADRDGWARAWMKRNGTPIQVPLTVEDVAHRAR